jgi:outer membrane immunogenic protein
MVSKFAVAAIAALGFGFVQAAAAADMPVKMPVKAAPIAPPVYNWTGFYIGINGGGGWGETSWTYTVALTTADHNSNGGLVGGTIGYNYQFPNNFVVGVEADWDWADINGSAACPNPAFSCESKIKDIGTARGRIGYAWDKLLVYGTGGVAWGDVTIQTVLPGGAVPPSGTPTNGQTITRVGWVGGVGAEYAIWQRLTVKAEWLYYDLGTDTFAVDNGLFVSARERGNMFRGGLNWHF